MVRVVKDFRGIGAKFQKLHLKLPEVGVGGRQDAADFRALNSNMCGHTKSNDVSNEAGEAGSTRRSLESATRRASGGAAQKPLQSSDVNMGAIGARHTRIVPSVRSYCGPTPTKSSG